MSCNINFINLIADGFLFLKVLALHLLQSLGMALTLDMLMVMIYVDFEIFNNLFYEGEPELVCLEKKLAILPISLIN